MRVLPCTGPVFPGPPKALSGHLGSGIHSESPAFSTPGLCTSGQGRWRENAGTLSQKGPLNAQFQRLGAVRGSLWASQLVSQRMGPGPAPHNVIRQGRDGLAICERHCGVGVSSMGWTPGGTGGLSATLLEGKGHTVLGS